MILETLATDISKINSALRENASKAINKCVTARNWLIGCSIMIYEQQGEDRARYGERILQSLAERLNEDGLSYRNLKLFRQFYQSFPELEECVCEFITHSFSIGQQATDQFQFGINMQKMIGQPLDAQSNIRQNNSNKYDDIINPKCVFESLSYSHLVQLMNIADPAEKVFYEVQAIKGIWSKRELKRQIDSNLYLRTGLSQKKDAVIVNVNSKAEMSNITDIIRSPYTFEFLGLKGKDVVEEDDLESALIDHLQEFILELGNGFCFEARQKRILIDEKYYFYDLLFYNRVLHCGVIVELKMGELDYSDLAQLNMYVNFYKRNLMNEGDNPPIGLLLCSKAGKEMVEYASPGIDENVFISTYMLQLPSKESLLQWLRQNSFLSTK